MLKLFSQIFTRMSGLLLGTIALAIASAGISVAQEPPADFKGVIKTDIRDSTPDWAPFTPAKAPDGAPNILFVLYDDTGLAAWSPYGGGVEMPTLDKIADQGLIYTNWNIC